MNFGTPRRGFELFTPELSDHSQKLSLCSVTRSHVFGG